MRALGEYIVSISAAAFIFAIVSSLMPKGNTKEILRLVGGLFLAFCVIRPIADLQIPDLSALSEVGSREAREAAGEGEELAQRNVSERIKQDLEAYILDKAGELRLQLNAEVILSEESFLPEELIISGDASPNARQEMILFLTREVGIQKENIQWNK